MKNKPIVIISGQPKSIFLEIFFKSLKKKITSPIVLICCKKILLHSMKIFNFKKKINILDADYLQNKILDNKKINLIDVKFDETIKSANQKLINKYIKNSFSIGLKLMKNNFSNKLINGPINKKSFLNKKFLGMTEYISRKSNSKNTCMLIYNENLSVCPLTTHLPLKLVTKKINIKNIEKKIQLLNSFYIQKIGFKPRIGVTGINPHCESILNFNEDDKIVAKAIHSQKNRGINVFGPFPADTIFLKKNRAKFDVILGMYHDQVLSPIKVIHEFNAINITIGLPFIRVTPDHGPNEKMVGKNSSKADSLIKAIKFLDKF